MLKLRTATGDEAVIDQSCGFWLSGDDFVTSEGGVLDPLELGRLGFPRDWPAAYTQNSALKSLIGKRGQIPGKRVAVAGVPAPGDKRPVSDLTFHPLQSFANAERAAAQASELVVVRGWAVFERFDRPSGTAFVAERYWWNAFPDGRWVDLTPRPEAWPSVLLAEAAQGAPKKSSLLTAREASIARHLLARRFPEAAALERPPPSAPLPTVGLPATVAAATAKPTPKATAQAQAQAQAREAHRDPQRVATPLDYSKWKHIVDSDDEGAEEGVHNTGAPPAARDPQGRVPDYGVKDVLDTQPHRKQPPVPDYLTGNTGGGGGTNCYLSICKLLDADVRRGETSENTHQLAQVFGKTFHCGMLDQKRQRFYKDALASIAAEAFVVVIGLGSVLPMLLAARRGVGRGMLLEMSVKLAKVSEDLLAANGLSFPVVAVPEGLDKEEPVLSAVKQHLPDGTRRVVILTERFANDLLSNGVVPCSVVCHAAVLACVRDAEVRHIPQTVELFASPTEIRSEKLGEFDIRPFNAFRHTTSNDKADFWWWGVRLDNQPNTRVALLGPPKTLCGFDLDRAPEIKLDEVRRTLKLEITGRGRCNACSMWWTAKFGELEYSTRPRLAQDVEDRGGKEVCRPEWKQAVHYLAGETAVFVGDVLEVVVSITPRFTVRMMQQSPFSVEAPEWIRAPAHAKFSATMPILPYHFLMLTDLERLRVYCDAIAAAVRQQRARLGRRPRVLDAGCGIGVLGMSAALEGADVWLCEAVPQMRQMCREVVAVNASLVTERKGLVQLLPPMMSTRLQVGEDIEEKFDVIVSEVLDLWCLGEGVIPTMRHAHNTLLASDGVMVPSRLVIFTQPLELSLWKQSERDHKVSLSPLESHFKTKFSPLRIAQVPHRWLSDDAVPALEIDLKSVPAQPADGEPNLDGVKLCIRMGGKPALYAKISSATVDHSGMLSGYGIWWAADLGNGHVITSAPSSPQRSWKQLVRWIDEPRFVSEGEDVQVLACYNDNQVNIEDVHMPREMVEQYQEQLQAESMHQHSQHTQAEAVAAAKTAAAGARPRLPARPAGTPTQEDEDEDVVEVD